MTIKCNHCDSIFDDSELVVESKGFEAHPIGDGVYHEELLYDVCPFCGSENWSELDEDDEEIVDDES